MNISAGKDCDQRGFYEATVTSLGEQGVKPEEVQSLVLHREDGMFFSFRVRGIHFYVLFEEREKKWWTNVDNKWVSRGRKDFSLALKQTARAIVEALPAGKEKHG